MSYATQKKQGEELNRLYEEDLPVHEWYRFVLSFPPHLVRDYIETFGLSQDQRILDPFCGTGTTLVEAKKLGIASVGIEANPVVHFAASVKTNWETDPDTLLTYATNVAQKTQTILDSQGLDDRPLFRLLHPEPAKLKTLPDEQQRLLIKDSISPLPLQKWPTPAKMVHPHFM